MFFVFEQNKFCKPEQREDNSYYLPMGQSKFSYELTIWFVSTENGGKQKRKKYIESRNQSVL